jgi:hypothetical protein
MSNTGSHWSFPPPLPVGAMPTPTDLYGILNYVVKALQPGPLKIGANLAMTIITIYL